MTQHTDNVLVLAATNMPWDVDAAMKRPGRFDRQVFVPPPDAAARAEMFRRKLVDVPTEDVDTVQLAALSEHFSGADVDGVINRAKDCVLLEIMDGGIERPIRQSDLLAAIEASEPTTLDWLRTARNIVKFGGVDRSYKEVAAYLKRTRLI
jgi:SpoVK/Ycf46/Vps4 family AAA+-type ATPase